MITPHQSLVDVSNKLFKLLIEELDVSTAYIAKKDANVMRVINSSNKNEKILPNNMIVDYDESNCRFVLESDRGIGAFSNLMENEETRDRKITEQLKVKAFLGVPLNRTNGNEFGTLCVMDKEEKVFDEKQMKFMQTIAGVLAYIIELDEAYEDIELLSVPIIPISSELVILALQGNINKKRGLKILEDALTYAIHHRIRNFAIDLSQMNRTDEEFINLLHHLVSALKLMGVSVMLSGIPVKLADNRNTNQLLQDLNVQYVRNIEEALRELGYEIKKSST